MILVAAALIAPDAPAAGVLRGRVVRVHDGDTIYVVAGRRRHSVLLATVDAPEALQPYGEASRNALEALLAGRDVLVEWTKRDRYKRLIGKVLVSSCTVAPCPEPIDAGLHLVAAGLAWHDARYAEAQSAEDRVAYAAAQQQARAARRGLWQDPEPVAPWEWREK